MDECGSLGEPIGSIIVPAWNEAAGIARTLTLLLDGVAEGTLDVVVACNGCTDSTPQIVRDLRLPVRVLDLPAVGKAGAIRAAEKVTDVLPRIYLDADVDLPGPAAVAVIRALRADAVAARPPVRYDTAGASWLVRRYYSARSALPSVAADLCGAGVYGLSATARARFGEFPAVLGDDVFAARIVAADEVQIVDSAPITVHTPRRVRALVATLGRAYSGNRELSTVLPDHRRTTAGTARELRTLARSPRHWPDVGVYLAVVVAARVAARRRTTSWQRDDSSREVVAA